MKRIILALFLLLPNLAFAQITQQEVLNKISSNLPTNNANEISATLLRNTLDYMTSSIFQGGPIPSGVGVCPPVTGLTTFQFYANTTAAPTGTTLNVFDGNNCVQWAILNQTTHTITGSFDGLSIIGAQGSGALLPQNPQVVMGQSVASASVWLGQFTYPYGPYAWITGQFGNGAQLLGNHSAEWDPSKSAVVDVITSQVYGYHDNPIFTGYSDIWTNYWVGAKTATAYAKTNVQILEASFINLGGMAQANPVYVPDGVNDPVGSTNGLTVDCGLGTPGVPVGNPCTGAYQVINNGQSFYTGLRMTINSIVPSTSGFYEAIQLSSNPIGTVGGGHSIVWYTGTPCAPHPCSPSGLAISGFVEVDNSSVMRLFGTNGISTVSPFASLINTAASTVSLPISFSSTAGFGIYFGSGVPTNSAAQSSLYLRSDGGVYLNTTGSTTWDQITSNTATQTLTNKTIAFASNTLTGVAPTASPTFTGTVTGPDSTTWTSSGWSSLTSVGAISGNTLTLTAAPPTVSASQVGYGATIHTAGATNCPSTMNTSVSTTQAVQGCIVINVAGTNRQIPFFTSP